MSTFVSIPPLFMCCSVANANPIVMRTLHVGQGAQGVGGKRGGQRGAGIERSSAPHDAGPQTSVGHNGQPPPAAPQAEHVGVVDWQGRPATCVSLQRARGVIYVFVGTRAIMIVNKSVFDCIHRKYYCVQNNAWRTKLQLRDGVWYND